MTLMSMLDNNNGGKMNNILSNEKFQYLVSILVDEALQVLESYKRGSFGGTGIECAILADPRLAMDDYIFSHKGKDIAKNITKKLKDLKAKGDKDSQYLRALGNPGKMFGIKLLRDDEIFVTNKKILRHKIAILMRFPCSSAGENLRAKIVDFGTIKSFNTASGRCCCNTILEYELIMDAMKTGTLYRQEQGIELKDSPLFRRYDVFCTSEECNNILDGDEVEFVNGESTDGRFFTGRIVNGMRPVFRDNFGGLFTVVHLMEVIEEPVDDKSFVVRVSGTKKSLDNAKNIFAAKNYGYEFFLLPNSKGGNGDGLYVVSDKAETKGKLVKVVGCEIPGDKVYMSQFCGKVVLDEAMFNTIEKGGYGNDVHTICLLCRKA